MLHALNIYRRLISVQVRSQMQYRVSFLVEMFSIGLTSILEYGSIALVFTRFDNLGGWKLGQVTLLYGLAEFSFGIMDLVFSGFDPGYFGLQVRRGALDQLLLRPVNLFVQILGSEFVLRRFGKIFIGLAILISGLSQTAIAWSLPKVGLIVAVVIGQICFFGGLFIIGATIAFWTVESIEVVNIFTYGGSYMISFPMHIYPDILRHFFTYVVPAIFLAYYPALYILELPDPFGMPGFAPFLAPFAGLGMLLAALGFWRFGMQHYQSTGT